MILAATGHRPDKLGGYDEQNPLRTWVRAQIHAALEDLKPEKAISGMALGVDSDFAEACVALGIPFIAAVPFQGQESRWPQASQERYKKLLARAAEVVYVSPPGYATWKFHARNQYMVDNCNLLLAVFDGSVGGTSSTVCYASSRGCPIRLIDPNLYSGEMP